MKRNMVIEYVERDGMVVPQAKYIEEEKSNDGILRNIARASKRAKALRQWADHLLEDIDEQEEAEKAAKAAKKE